MEAVQRVVGAAVPARASVVHMELCATVAATAYCGGGAGGGRSRGARLSRQLVPGTEDRVCLCQPEQATQAQQQSHGNALASARAAWSHAAAGRSTVKERPSIERCCGARLGRKAAFWQYWQVSSYRALQLFPVQQPSVAVCARQDMVLPGKACAPSQWPHQKG